MRRTAKIDDPTRRPFAPWSMAALAMAMVIATASPARAAAPAGSATVNTANAVSDGLVRTATLVFSVGYSPIDWSGYLVARHLNADGSLGATAWDAGEKLAAAAPDSRIIVTAKYNVDGSFRGGLPFSEFGALDALAQSLLMQPPPAGDARDTGQARVDWLRGGRGSEANGSMRKRASILGAIVRSQPLYVANPADGYRNRWPNDGSGQQAPESAAAEHPAGGTGYVSYAQFAQDNAGRTAVVYVGASDGMLHAFDASRGDDGNPAAGAGTELWAYVPRAAYAQLGELTRRADSGFIPLVDASPISRDVFFSRASTTPVVTTPGWHTILVGGLGGGGRGVYALDVTQPGPAPGMSSVSVADAVGRVLWEFDAGMPAVGSSRDAGGTNLGGTPADLGYTVGQPNIGRLANGRWAVLIPGGVEPECKKSPASTGCAFDGGAHGYSALFVVDAQTGALIAELKTPTTIAGVASRGLSSAVLGDYNDDQIDDVAFAGDEAGNLWRYDLSSGDPAQWTVKLAYQPDSPGAQPITVMPRLLPDSASNRFIIVFGTGGRTSLNRALADGTSADTTTQAVYGIRDTGHTVAGARNLIAQTLSEKAGTGSGCSSSVRSLTSNAVPPDKDGWYFNLIAPGERVELAATTLFETNRVVITTSFDRSQSCAGMPQGAVMIVDAATGGAGDGIALATSTNNAGTPSSKSVGGRIDSPPRAGLLPVAGEIGGGKLVFPGISLSGGAPLRAGDAVWRQRSWRELLNGL